MQEFDVKVSDYLGNPVITVIGEIDLVTVAHLYDADTEVDDAPNVVLDLSRVTYCETVGIKWLLSWCRRQKDKKLILVPSPIVRKVLDVTHFSKFFTPMFDDVLTAYALLNPPRDASGNSAHDD